MPTLPWKKPLDNFSARETEWLLELDGIPLAGFWPRAIAFGIDSTIAWVITTILVTAFSFGYRTIRHEPLIPQIEIQKLTDAAKASANGDPAAEEQLRASAERTKEYKETPAVKFIEDILVPVLYFGIFLWRGKGQTFGKRIMKVRVVSLMHRHLSLWHSVERALGYGAAFLEGGFGFAQFFIHPYRRCVQDRIAETIVVTEAGYQAMQHKLSHPLIPDTSKDLGNDDAGVAAS